MSAYFLYDGQNELGPFSLEHLQQQKLKRNTPIRLQGSNKWKPAEKVDGLKEAVRPTKIQSAKDVVPVLADRLTDLHQRKPLLLYGTLLVIILLLSLSIYTSGRTTPPKAEPMKLIAPIVATTPPLSELPQRDTVQQKTVPPPPKVEVKPVVKKRVEEDPTKAARQQWRKTIMASNSNYGIGVLGGIKGLEVIISNQSNYMVDEVIAKVTYWKASGEEWKSVFVSTYGVRPHDSKAIPVEDVSRGKKVQVSLYKVVSRKMKLFYQEGQKVKDYTDPYLAATVPAN